MQTQSLYTYTGLKKSIMGVKFKVQSLTSLDNKITNKTLRCYGK